MARTNQSVKRVQQILEQLPAKVKAPILAATFGQAEKLRRTMIFFVPVGTSGHLRDSIRVEKSDRSEMRVLVRAGGQETSQSGYDYALAAEFGTQYMPAKPFFWPAYRRNKASIRREIKSAAKRAINDAWKP